MRVLWLQHADHEDLGCIAPWLAAHGLHARCIALQSGEPLPAVDEVDALLVLGGPMNVDEHAAHPWLAAEKIFIREVIDAGRHVLGICLGAQLMARALGAEVRPNRERELGWFEVQLQAQGRDDPRLTGWPDRFEAFHWHGDTFALPAGASWLAASEACAHQGFAWGERALGLQFHLEVTAVDARRWFDLSPPDSGPYVQPASAVLPRLDAFAANNRLMCALLDRFFA